MMDMTKLELAKSTNRALAATNLKLREIIEKAPHASSCGITLGGFVGYEGNTGATAFRRGVCNCWKKEANELCQS